MKINKAISKTVVHFVMLTTLITAAGSCTSNDNTTTAGNLDSTNSNTLSTVTNENDQNRAMNDSAGTNADNANADASFMMKAAEINMEEIKLGKLAQQKGTMSHVKELGKMMVTEHEKAMAALTTLGKTKTVDIPATETDKIEEAYKTLSAKTGKDFDKAYSDMMVNGHKEAIALFEKTNMETKDAAVKEMTTAMLPKLKVHLEHAEICQKECAKM